jgi:hypothetical protein
MKYVARFVFFYYDEFDTTQANVYDILVEADSPSAALENAMEILPELTKAYSPGPTDFISLTDENGVIYVSSLARKGYYGESLPLSSSSQLVILPKEAHDKLPKTFCNTGETFFVVDSSDKLPKMRFPLPR